jgi:hypothetical protein
VADYPSGQLTDAAQRRERKVVEAAARELSSIDPDLRGSLAYQPFARILQRVYADRLTGALLMLRESVKKIVYFVDGYPVSVRSNILGECLGQILLQQKMISKQTLEESLQRMKADKKHQGTVLVEMGALSPYNLSRPWPRRWRPSSTRSSPGARATSPSRRARARPTSRCTWSAPPRR